jgi:chromosome segregation ATPase
LKTNKKLQQTVSELQSQIEDEQKQRAEARENAVAAERRANQLLVDLDDTRSSIEQQEKARKAVETELHESSDRVNELNAANSNLSAFKRKLEGDLQALRSELEESRSEIRNSLENAKRAASDSARLAEELRAAHV